MSKKDWDGMGPNPQVVRAQERWNKQEAKEINEDRNFFRSRTKESPHGKLTSFHPGDRQGKQAAHEEKNRLRAEGKSALVLKVTGDWDQKLEYHVRVKDHPGDKIESTVAKAVGWDGRTEEKGGDSEGGGDDQPRDDHGRWSK